MERRTVLAGLGSSILAVSGCTSGGDTDGTEPNGTAPDETESGLAMPSVEPVEEGQPRPNCTIQPASVEVGDPDDPTTHGIVGTIPYPDPPAELTADEVVSFVEAHERAYIRHDTFCSTEDVRLITAYYYDVRRSWIVENDTEGFTVPLVYVGGGSSGVTKGGYTWHADLAPTGAVYNVTEQRAARAEFPELPQLESEAEIAEVMPDPVEDGEVLVRF